MIHLLSIFILFFSPATLKFTFRGDAEINQKKHELQAAQKKLAQQQAYVEKLANDLARCQMEHIKKEILKLKKEDLALNPDELSEYFITQREILTQIIQDQPVHRPEAQEILDQILMLITRLSDSSLE